MGLRDNLRRSLDQQLHSCTPYAVQPCNQGQKPATSDATTVQPQGAPPRQSDATADATSVQLPSCIGVAEGETAADAWQREAFEERAAIREHDGGQSRDEAEAGAAADLWRMSKGAAADCHEGGWSAIEQAQFIRWRNAFAARGAEYEKAEGLAERLVLRDRQHDDRRLCLECTHLGDRGRCLAAATGRLPGVDRRLEPVPDMLQRCPAFGLRRTLVVQQAEGTR